MAANQEPPTINTPFPNPPSFWESFTEENVTAYDDLPSNVKDNPSVIPEHLTNLQPPALPENETYTIFGTQHSLSAPLQQLPADAPFLLPPPGVNTTSPIHLLNLTRSLLLSYLELMQILSLNPAPPLYGAKWGDLRTLFRNVHHVLNTYRPWQARDALIRLLETTRDRAKREIEVVNGLRNRVDGVLGGVKTDCEGLVRRATEDEEDVMDGIEVNGVELKQNGFTNRLGSAEAKEALLRQQLWEMANEDSDG